MRVEIEGRSFTLWRDYDQGKLRSLSYLGKTQWFEERLRFVLVRPLRKLLVSETRRRRRSKQWSQIIIFGNALFSGIEALGSFYRGGRANQSTFAAFITAYMPKRYRKHTKNLRENFRNGLAHELAVKQGGFAFSRGGAFLRDREGRLGVDPARLLVDFEEALARYVAELRREGERSSLGKHFVRRFRQVFKA